MKTLINQVWCTQTPHTKVLPYQEWLYTWNSCPSTPKSRFQDTSCKHYLQEKTGPGGQTQGKYDVHFCIISTLLCSVVHFLASHRNIQDTSFFRHCDLFEATVIERDIIKRRVGKQRFQTRLLSGRSPTLCLNTVIILHIYDKQPQKSHYSTNDPKSCYVFFYTALRRLFM